MKNIFAALAAVTVVAGGISFTTVTTADAQSRGYQNNSQQRGAPRGSYSRSCSGAYVNQGRLYADCTDLRGRTRETSIVLSRCSSSDISNNDGLLVCNNVRGDYEDSNRPNRPNRPDDNNRPDRPNRPGGDNWNNGRGGSITVYRDSQYRGQSATFDREVANLRNLGMNDAISSFRVSRGNWEVCEDANFRGRCITVRGDDRDLARMGWNDKISSIRPVGGRR